MYLSAITVEESASFAGFGYLGADPAPVVAADDPALWAPGSVNWNKWLKRYTETPEKFATDSATATPAMKAIYQKIFDAAKASKPPDAGGSNTMLYVGAGVVGLAAIWFFFLRKR